MSSPTELEEESNRERHRCVCFDEHPVRVHSIPNVPEECRRLVWYAAEEYQGIFDRDYLLIQLKKCGAFEESEDHTFRGLERHTRKEAIAFIRARAVLSVIREQKLQTAMAKPCPETIAEKYRSETNLFAKYARLTALRDAREAIIASGLVTYYTDKQHANDRWGRKYPVMETEKKESNDTQSDPLGDGDESKSSLEDSPVPSCPISPNWFFRAASIRKKDNGQDDKPGSSHRKNNMFRMWSCKSMKKPNRMEEGENDDELEIPAQARNEKAKLKPSKRLIRIPRSLSARGLIRMLSGKRLENEQDASETEISSDSDSSAGPLLDTQQPCNHVPTNARLLLCRTKSGGHIGTKAQPHEISKRDCETIVRHEKIKRSKSASETTGKKIIRVCIRRSKSKMAEF